MRETVIHLGEPPAVVDIGVRHPGDRPHRGGLPQPPHRLFRSDTGTTVVAYIRRRRLERADHPLRASTLSIPAVAASVGIPDLQAFNKACRRELGASPRTLRGATS